MTANPAQPGKPQVDLVVHARWLLPMTQEGLLLERHSVVVQQRRIIDLLPSDQVPQRYQPRQEVHLPEQLLMPGLINAHGHSPMTLLRGYADDMPLQPWLEERIWPAEGRWMSETFVRDGSRLAMAEMLLSGTTCFSDMYFFPDQVGAAATEARIRVQLASPILDFPTVWGSGAEDYIHKATLLHDDFRDNEYVYTAFGPHAPYTVSDPPLRKLSILAEELDIPIHIHLHENAMEVQQAVQQNGLRPLQRLAALGLLSERLQCVHMTQVDEQDIALLAADGARVIHCPASNLKLASGFCPVVQLRDAGIQVGLGTDGAASNNALDMFQELRLAALLAKGSSGRAEALPAWQALAMATCEGARVLGLDQHLGSLEAGKFADMIAVDFSHCNSQPLHDPLSALVYSTNSRQVSHVWVGGQLNVLAGKLTHLDAAYLKQSAAAWASKIQQD